MDPEPILPQPEPIISPSTPPTRKFSPILILAVVILLVTVGAGGIFLGKSLNTSQPSAQPTVIPLPTQIPTPTPDETANWKTYTNTKYGFSVKYPTDWVVLEKNDYVRFFQGPYASGEPTSETYVSILMRGDSQHLSLQDWLEKYKPSDETPNFTTINNAPSVKYISTKPIGTGSVFCFIENNGVVYQIASVLMGDNIDRTKAVFDQILATFKFTPP